MAVALQVVRVLSLIHIYQKHDGKWYAECAIPAWKQFWFQATVQVVCEYELSSGYYKMCIRDSNWFALIPRIIWNWQGGIFTKIISNGHQNGLMRHIAVSYTHLDVYKRQPPHSRFTWNGKIRITAICSLVVKGWITTDLLLLKAEWSGNMRS